MIVQGDCRDVLRGMDADSIDSIVCDPPYGLTSKHGLRSPQYGEGGKKNYGETSNGFMGMRWDGSVPGVEFWEEAIRVLKPGGYLLAFGGTRTFHRLAVGIEDAGFEIRDCLSWNFGSGFPKSLDVSKAIDRAAGAEREIIQTIPDRWAGKGNVLQRSTQDTRDEAHITAPATPEAEQWQGWGTALKPAWEPIIMARKPLSEKTVAANVLRWGTGAINVDGCRIGLNGEQAVIRSGERDIVTTHEGYTRPNKSMYTHKPKERSGPDNPAGRWPPNVALDEEAAALLDEMSGERASGHRVNPSIPNQDRTAMGKFADGYVHGERGYQDTGGASRFMYVAKASRAERNAGLEGMPESLPLAPNGSPNAVGVTRGSLSKPRANHHPTVKPIALMRWLVRMVTPPGGTVCDPFTGSGSTGLAAFLEGFEFIGIELDEDYCEIARARIAHAHSKGRQVAMEAP